MICVVEPTASASLITSRGFPVNEHFRPGCSFFTAAAPGLDSSCTTQAPCHSSMSCSVGFALGARCRSGAKNFSVLVQVPRDVEAQCGSPLPGRRRFTAALGSRRHHRCVRMPVQNAGELFRGTAEASEQVASRSGIRRASRVQDLRVSPMKRTPATTSVGLPGARRAISSESATQPRSLRRGPGCRARRKMREKFRAPLCEADRLIAPSIPRSSGPGCRALAPTPARYTRPRRAGARIQPTW